MDLEQYAVSRYPKDGKCKQSAFANGKHRAAMVPVESSLDGGASGDYCCEVCLDCKRWFKKTVFVIRRQPSFVGDRSHL